MSIPLMLTLWLGCAGTSEAPKADFPPLNRSEFNQRAVELDAPVFWRIDEQNPGILDAGEVVALWRPGSPGHYLEDGQFTAEFIELVEKIARGEDTPKLTDDEKSRRKLVLKELRQGRVTLVYSDASTWTAPEREFIKHIQRAADSIERLHAQQMGVSGLDVKIPADDPASRALFYRNQGPWCSAPETRNAPGCSALPEVVEPIFGLYPAALQTDTRFCASLEAENPEWMKPFVVVQPKGETYQAVPYTQAFAKDMAETRKHLEAAAAALPPEEAALRDYLLAAGEAFSTNDWYAADAKWAAMNAENSKWYLRVGPDETYFEPCNRKAGFHLVIARMNPGAKEWKQKLEPLKTEIENHLAEIAGPPYVAREVGFDLPEFIDIVLNAGDSRRALGATIGQSLPNWGPVADAGGRTVAMANLNDDPDSVAAKRSQVESLFCPASMPHWTDSPEPLRMSTVLHEAAHNLGPAHEYKVDGEIDEQRFGGPLAAIYEEMKAQTAALYLTDWLADRKVIEPHFAAQTHAADLFWSMGKMAEGLTNPSGGPEPYAQLSAVELGYFHDHGGMVWSADLTAENGTDKGCFVIDPPALKQNIADLNREVLQIKSTGDRARAEALVQKYTAVEGNWAQIREEITTRIRRSPQPSFVYAIGP